MDLGDLIDRCIEPFAPSRARRRQAERMALKQQRQYEAAGNGRRTQGWKRTNGSADREVRTGLRGARNGARELVRNNKYAASALRQMTANAIGDGIEARAVHADESVAAKAQAFWENWSHGPVDGRHDFYGVQKLIFRGTVEGGEMLQVWSPDETGPDARLKVIEGDLLDDTKNNDVDGAGRIVQGVEFAGNGDRAAYWLLPRHPGDLGGAWGAPSRFDARDVDHVYEQLRADQTRGISWFAPVAMDLRDVGDYEQARLMKEKVAACLALVLTPPDQGPPTNPFDEAAATAPGPADAKAPDTIRPGLIFRARPGETAHTVQPPSGGDSMDFIRQQVAAICANLAPYHLVSGDVSQANYSSLRAALLGFWANLDDWQQNMLIPFCCNPAFARQMRRLYLQTGDKRFLEVKAVWAPPVRRFVDPLKDIMGEKAEIRAGLKTQPQALSERGRNWKPHLAEQAAFNVEADRLKLAFDTDARRIDGSGAIQAPAGYLASGASSDRSTAQAILDGGERVAEFYFRAAEALERGEQAGLDACLIEAADAIRAEDPAGPLMSRALIALLGGN